MSFSSRLSSMVERNVTMGTSESAPPPLDIILPVVLLAFFLVVLIAWRWSRCIIASVHSFKTLCNNLTTCLISRCWKAKGDVEDKSPLLERSITTQMRGGGLEAAITN